MPTDDLLDTEQSEDLRPPRSARRLRKPTLVIASLAAVSLVAWQAAARWPASRDTPEFTTASVQRADVRSVVTASGTLSPLVQVQVSSQISGRIKELHVDFNSEVKKGQLLAVIAPELFESALAQAEARLTSARAALARAQAQSGDASARYGRVAGLGETGAIAKVDADTALADKHAAQSAALAASADVTLAKAAVDQARSNLGYTKITSPIDGIVVSRAVDVGQTVAASLSAPTLFVLAEDLRKMELHTNVSESDVGQISSGQKVEFSVDAYPDTVFEGSVRQVRYAAQTVSNVVTYDAVVLVENDALKLRPGMTANATFVVAERKDVLTVPNTALRYHPAQTAAAPSKPAGRALWILRDGTPSSVRVRLGLSDGSITEITEGALNAGDAVIVADARGATVPSAAATPAAQTQRTGNTRNGGQGRRGSGARPPSIL